MVAACVPPAVGDVGPGGGDREKGGAVGAEARADVSLLVFIGLACEDEERN